MKKERSNVNVSTTSGKLASYILLKSIMLHLEPIFEYTKYFII